MHCAINWLHRCTCAVQVWQYKRALGACLPADCIIQSVYPRDFASALSPLVAYKERLAGCSRLPDGEREQVNSTDWMEGVEECIRYLDLRR